MSSNSKSLGRLESVDLREVWDSEAGDFTPWLAREENLKLLADAVGIEELAFEAQEQGVGPFRADIVCKDTATDGWVVVESQLDRTDHDHLGKSLTYAAGLKAATVIWIAREFTDEHRAAIDWLNDLAGGSVNFFGVEMELWRIGDSPVAPKFSVIARPNIGATEIRKVVEGTLSSVRSLQLEYWTGLGDVLVQRKSVVKPTKPPAAHNGWAFAVGKAGFWLGAKMNTQKHWIRASIACRGKNALAYFQLLKKEMATIEQETGCALEWEDLPEKIKRISLRRGDTDPTDRDNWATQHEWLAEKLEAFYRTFSPRIRDLAIEDEQEPDDE
jgi:hypothetical protein